MRAAAQEKGRDRQATFDRDATPVPKPSVEGAGYIAHLQRTIGNQAVQRLLAHSGRADPHTLPARVDSDEEQRARVVDDRIRRAPAGVGPLTAHDAGAGVTALSEAGRRYFEPLVGGALDQARLHVDGRADRLAELAGARALAYGNDVFIPRDQFSPESDEGRALLGHELAHVARAQTARPQLYRQPRIEPHYPTPDDQAKIAELLSREAKATQAPPPTPGSPNPVVTKGRALTPAEVQKLAESMESDFERELNKLDSPLPSTGAVLNEAEAFTVLGKARDDIFERFGRYARRPLTLIRDQATTPATRRAANQVLALFTVPPDIIEDLARTLISTHCKDCLLAMSDLDSASRTAAVTALRDLAIRNHREKLQRVALHRVPGSYSRDQERIQLRLKPEKALYATAVHELMHALEHPAFRAAFSDEDNIIEGFTEYFANQVVSEVSPDYADAVAKVKGVKGALSGPFRFSLWGDEAEESLRLAYFSGRLDLIGWVPSDDAELKAVAAAGGSGPWDPALAAEHAKTYRAQARAAQGPRRNVLGIGLSFSTKPGDPKTIAVRYGRVFFQNEPYAKWRLSAEGQIWGSPTRNPVDLGASLGVAVEYQEPFFYATGGARFGGSAVPADGTTRLDFSPFLGVGLRLQPIRLGLEGFLVVPVTGQEEREYGGTINVGVEFGK